MKKYMKLYKYISILLFLVVLLTGCGSSGAGGDKTDEADEIKPSVKIYSPAINSSFNAGNELRIEIDISDNVELNNYIISIQRTGTKTVKTIEEFSFNSQSDKDKNGNELPTIKGSKKAKVSFDIGINEFAEEGVYVLTCTAYDAMENEEMKKTEFTINRN